MPLTLDEEKALLDRARKGDSPAFGVLFDEFYPNIFGYIHRRVLDWDVAKDITSETFLKAYTHLNRYRWLGISLVAWLYRIATNEVNMYFRKGRYAPASLNQLHDESGEASPRIDVHDPGSGEREEAERQLQDYRDFLAIQAALKTLDVKYQEVIALRFFEEKSLLDIAEILGKPEGTIKSLLSRGLEKIRRIVQPNSSERID